MRNKPTWPRCCGIAVFTAGLAQAVMPQAFALGGDKDASVKVTRGDEIKGKSAASWSVRIAC